MVNNDDNEKVDEDIMVQGAKNALKVVLSVTTGEQLLIVTDEHKTDIATAFSRGGAELGANVRTYTLPES